MLWNYTVQTDTTLGSVLKETLPLPHYRIKDLLAQGKVSINEKICRKDVPVLQGDIISMDPAMLPCPKVLYIDEQVLLVEKPVNMIVCEDARMTLCDILSAHGHAPVFPCHRLDAGTGGVLLLARNEKAGQAARQLFESHLLEKTYLCICTGLPKASAELTAYLRKDNRRGQVFITPEKVNGSVRIRTDYELLLTQGQLSLLKVTLHTGRTHQIRAHLAFEGLPLLGDDKYGNRQKNRVYSAKVPCLWAYQLTFPKELPAPLAGLSGQAIKSPPRFNGRAGEPFLSVIQGL